MVNKRPSGGYGRLPAHGLTLTVHRHELRIFFKVRVIVAYYVLLQDSAGHVDFREQLPPDGALLKEDKMVRGVGGAGG